jgi:hypothetical protein
MTDLNLLSIVAIIISIVAIIISFIHIDDLIKEHIGVFTILIGIVMLITLYKINLLWNF